MHGFNNKSVDEVLAKYDEMRVTMEEFLSNVAMGGNKKVTVINQKKKTWLPFS